MQRAAVPVPGLCRGPRRHGYPLARLAVGTTVNGPPGQIDAGNLTASSGGMCAERIFLVAVRRRCRNQ
jgi:hypothetical protein